MSILELTHTLEVNQEQGEFAQQKDGYCNL
jgi:hypothetical protein